MPVTAQMHPSFAVTCLTDLGDEVVLHVEDLQVSAPPLDVLDLLDVLLMQRNFLQGEDLAVVVLGPPADQVLRDWAHKNTKHMRTEEML